MKEVGDSSPSFDAFYDHIVQTQQVNLDLIQPSFARRFVDTTMYYCDPERKTHEVAGSFLFGREDPIPKMFQQMLDTLEKENQEKTLNSFKYYLKRHIEVDGHEHGPMGCLLLEDLCGNDPQKWKEVEVAARESTVARCRLWDQTFTYINE